MSSVKRMQFRAELNAPANVVWRHITSPESYRIWTAAFAEGSHFIGSWDQGSRIQFLSPNGDGMVAEIAGSRLNEFISIRHLGFISKGIEDTTSEAAKSWAPAYENYTLIVMPTGTMMLVDQDVSSEWETYICEAWPKALALLKKLSEASESAA